MVRKAGKAHGLQQRIEGPSISGRRVVVVEDTSTTGGSPLAAVEAAREAGAEVVAVAVIADRASGAQEKIEAQGVPYRCGVQRRRARPGLTSARARPRARVAKTVYRRELAMTALIVVLVLVVLLALSAPAATTG